MSEELPTKKYSIAFKLRSRVNRVQQLEMIGSYLRSGANLISSNKNDNGLSATSEERQELVGGAVITICREYCKGENKFYSVRGEFVQGDALARKGLEAIAGELGLVRA